MEITEATLLSLKNYVRYKNLIPKHDCYWWLKSSLYILDDYKRCSTVVDNHGDLHLCNVAYDFGVSPALKISDLKSSDYQIGDKFEFGEHTFTIISDTLAQCNDIIGKCSFNRNRSLDNKTATKYKNSDIKKIIDKWYDKSLEKIKSEEKEEEVELE